VKEKVMMNSERKDDDNTPKSLTMIEKEVSPSIRGKHIEFPNGLVTYDNW